jgi:hypothetical protein
MAEGTPRPRGGSGDRGVPPSRARVALERAPPGRQALRRSATLARPPGRRGGLGLEELVERFGEACGALDLGRMPTPGQLDQPPAGRRRSARRPWVRGMTQSAVPQMTSVGIGSLPSRLASTCRWPRGPSTARKLASVASRNPGWRAARYCSTSQDRGVRQGRRIAGPRGRRPIGRLRGGGGAHRDRQFADAGEALGDQGRVDRPAQSGAVHQTQGGDPFGLGEGQLEGDQSAQGVARNGRLVEADGVHEAGRRSGPGGRGSSRWPGCCRGCSRAGREEDLVGAVQQRDRVGPVAGVVTGTVQ